MDAPPVVNSRQEEKVLVVEIVCSRLRYEPEVKAFGQALQDLMIGCQQPRIVIDFRAVVFLSAPALGKLVTLDGAIKRAEGQLRLCEVRREIYEIFRITRLNKLFIMDDDLETSLVILGEETAPV